MATQQQQAQAWQGGAPQQTALGPAVSLKPSDAVASGFMDDADLIILQARFALWDYNGKQQQSTFLRVDYAHLDGSPLPSPQYYSASDMKHFVPSADGKQAIAVGGKQSLNEGTNAVLWLRYMVNSGFPEDKIGNDISVFDGCAVHVNQVPAPKREGLSQKEGATILVATKINSFPWDTKQPVNKPVAAGPAVAKPAGKPKATAEQVASPAPVAGNGADQEAIHSKAVEAVLSVLTAKGGSVGKPALAQEVFKLMSKDPQRNSIVQLAFKDEFLGLDGQPWAFDGTTLSM